MLISWGTFTVLSAAACFALTGASPLTLTLCIDGPFDALVAGVTRRARRVLSPGERVRRRGARHGLAG